MFLSADPDETELGTSRVAVGLAVQPANGELVYAHNWSSTPSTLVDPVVACRKL